MNTVWEIVGIAFGSVVVGMLVNISRNSDTVAVCAKDTSKKIGDISDRLIALEKKLNSTSNPVE